MNKTFCPHCGNNTLKKVAVTINEDGSMQMHFSRNPKVLNPKGKRVSAFIITSALSKPYLRKHAKGHKERTKDLWNSQSDHFLLLCFKSPHFSAVLPTSATRRKTRV